MPNCTFDELRLTLADLVAKQMASVDDVAMTLEPIKPLLSRDNYLKIDAELRGIARVAHKTLEYIQKLHEKAIRDGVTDLFNRAYFNEKIKEISVPSAAFLICDMDKFHDYNDKYGHLQGDVAIHVVAQTFNNVITDSRKPDERVLVARYGGEEFGGLLIPYLGDKAELYSLGELIRTRVENTDILRHPDKTQNDENYKKCQITIGAGILKPKESIWALIGRADDAMGKAKKTKQRNTTNMA